MESPYPSPLLCTECGEDADHWNHADKNKLGHFFTHDSPLLGGRTFVAPPKEKSPKIKRERPMPTHVDYKWWVRSEKRQHIIHTLAVKQLKLHDFAIERLTLDAEPDERLRELVLPDDWAKEMREIESILAYKLTIRKRGL